MNKNFSLYWIVVFVAFVLIAAMFSRNFIVERTVHYDDYGDIKKLILERYVDTVDINVLNEGALEGMLHKLDPHSGYLPPDVTTEANEDLNGEFDGIGVQFRLIDDTVNIIMPVPGGPSEKVGIKSGDKILRANDTIIAGVNMGTNDIVHKLKGKRGTKVKLTIKREAKLLQFDVTRAPIPTYSVEAKLMVDKETGYIRLNKFSTTTGSEMRVALRTLLDSGMNKLILDLRRNGGGLITQAIEVADEFLSDGKVIVSTKGRKDYNIEFATNKGLFEGKPIVVIIDEFSASASEIIAGALQDNDVATIVGRRSFGKGLVQQAIPLNNGGSIRLTIARYYTPTGRCIQRPYIKGETDPDEDLINKINSGELFSIEKVKLDSTQKYTTPKGKIVYGGGGIMPDVYVPYKIDSTKDYNKIIVNYNSLGYLKTDNDFIEAEKTLQSNN
jgi:carboxyl-terminal processing protease